VLFSCRPLVSFKIIILVCHLSFLPFVVNKDFQTSTSGGGSAVDYTVCRSPERYIFDLLLTVETNSALGRE